MGQPTELEWAYLAGVIDSDGCICISTDVKRFRLRVIITNTSLEMLQWVKETFQGNFRVCRPSKNKNRKTLYEWTVTDKKCLPILLGIKPYMKIKFIQCCVAVEFLGIMSNWDEEQEILWNEMKFLNQTGLHEESVAGPLKGTR